MVRAAPQANGLTQHGVGRRRSVMAVTGRSHASPQRRAHSEGRGIGVRHPGRPRAATNHQKIDTIFMVPTMFIRLLKLPEAVRKKYDVSSLRHIIHAAAPCPADVKRAMIDWWGPVIHEFYGSTECKAR